MSVPAWLSMTLAGLLYTVAQATCSTQAERDMHAAAETGQLAFRFDEKTLPATTRDGREVWREFHMQLPCVLWKLHDRGELNLEPYDVSIHAVCKVAGVIAGYHKADGCCHAKMRTLVKASHYSESVIQRVCNALEGNGFGRMYSRISPDERKIGGADEACTDVRTTVRVLWAVPPAIAQKLTHEELLDLIARGESEAEVLPPAGVIAPAPAPAASPKAPAKSPRPSAQKPGRGATSSRQPMGNWRPTGTGAAERDPDFEAFAEVFYREHHRHYGDGIDAGGVGTEGQAKIANAVSELVAEARAWALKHGLGELSAAALREDLCAHLVRLWLAWPGSDGRFLRHRAHPIGLIASNKDGDQNDLARFRGAALDAWKAEQRLPEHKPLLLPPPDDGREYSVDELIGAAANAGTAASPSSPPLLAPLGAAPALEQPRPPDEDELAPLRAKQAEIQKRGGREAKRPALPSLRTRPRDGP